MIHQNRELFFYKGTRLQSYDQPLNSHPRLTELLMETPACISEYGRTWSIENNKLYLVDLKNYLKNLLSDGNEDGLLFADWFTGQINFGQGNITLRGVHNCFEEYLSLHFEKGVLAEERVLTCDKAYQSKSEDC